jgi:hypothetical protein
MFVGWGAQEADGVDACGGFGVGLLGRDDAMAELAEDAVDGFAFQLGLFRNSGG